jgi:hypothetical protein
MKKLHKKIGAMALAGMVVAGGCIAGSGKVFADGKESSKISEEELQKKVIKKEEEQYRKENYKVSLPKWDKGKKIPLLGEDDDEEVKNIQNKLNGKIFKVIRISGEKDVIDKFVGPVHEVINDPDMRNLLEVQIYFENIDDFVEYIDSHNNSDFVDGLYRLQVGGVDGIYRVKK